MIDAFIRWAIKRAIHALPVITFEGAPLFDRYEFFRRDEWPDSWWDRVRDKFPERPNKLPWWFPVNAFLHHWNTADGIAESFHDHPRWSITICLRGKIIERTPWGDRHLKPGSIVLRSRKAIHAFKADKGAGEVWTMFIVGRRRHRQNTYVITAR